MNRDVVVVVGKTGQGKSLWAKLSTRAISRGLFYDPSFSFPDVEWMDDESLFKWYEGNENDFPTNFRIGTAFRESVDLLSNISFVAGDCTLVLEECHTIFTRGQLLPEWASLQIFYGRHARVSTLFISQRASSLPIDIRSQATRVISFLQSEPADLEWLSNSFGREVSRSQIPALKPLECLDTWNGDLQRYNIRAQAEKFLGLRLDIRQGSVLDGSVAKVSSETKADEANLHTGDT